MRETHAEERLVERFAALQRLLAPLAVFGQVAAPAVVHEVLVRRVEGGVVGGPVRLGPLVPLAVRDVECALDPARLELALQMRRRGAFHPHGDARFEKRLRAVGAHREMREPAPHIADVEQFLRERTHDDLLHRIYGQLALSERVVVAADVVERIRLEVKEGDLVLFAAGLGEAHHLVGGEVEDGELLRLAGVRIVAFLFAVVHVEHEKAPVVGQ